MFKYIILALFCNLKITAVSPEPKQTTLITFIIGFSSNTAILPVELPLNKRNLFKALELVGMGASSKVEIQLAQVRIIEGDSLANPEEPVQVIYKTKDPEKPAVPTINFTTADPYPLPAMFRDLPPPEEPSRKRVPVDCVVNLEEIFPNNKEPLAD